MLFRSRETYRIRPVVTAGAVIQPHLAAGRPRRMDEPVEPGKHDYLQLLEWAFADDTVDCIRVGLEDTPSHFGKNVSNEELVTLVRRECELAGVTLIRDAAQTTRLFGIRN